ncbi:nucleoside hydrolase, partial [Candidatus Poribacteria bacterium]
RKILSKQADRSVVVCAIGPLNNLSNLLKTDGDEYSPLNGLELVKAKVKRLAVMGGVFPEGLSWNLQQDGPAARKVIDEWPSPVIFSGREIGLMVKTGNRLYTETPESNPVRRAYELWTGGTDRPSWDQTTVLCAVRGTSDYWTASPRGRCVVRPDGYSKWQDDVNGKHLYLIQKMPVQQLAKEIEDMMLQSPCK